MKKKKVSGLSALVAAAAVLPLVGIGGVLPAWATPEDPSGFTTAPVTKEFKEFQLRSNRLGNDRNGGQAERSGLVPSPVAPHFSSKKTDLGKWRSLGDTNVPAKYDLRELDRLSPVKDQGPNGSCWAFATYGAMESNLWPQHHYDFSEKHLRNTHGFDLSPEQGGNAYMSTAYLARWSGPVDEKNDPYAPKDFHSPVNLPRERDLKDVYFFPDVKRPNDEAMVTLKRAIMNYGAIYTSIFQGDRTEDPMNKKTNSFYYNGPKDSNHAVTLVGWDDNYSAKNFKTEAPGNGAWIVRNSWGPNWGIKGYYYVSYYDTQVAHQNVTFLSKDRSEDNIYQYDPLGMTTQIGYRGNGVMANVFTAKNNENVKGVGFFVTSDDVRYEVSVVPKYTGPESLGTGKSVASGQVHYPGYTTIDFDGVGVKAGDKFAVVVKLHSDSDAEPIPVEKPFRRYSSRAEAEPGQSFVSLDGKDFIDLTTKDRNSNVALKAFTSNGSAPKPEPTPDPQPEPAPEPRPDPAPDPKPDPVTQKSLTIQLASNQSGYYSGDRAIVSFQVRDQDGRAVPDALIELEVRTTSGARKTAQVRTGENGIARISMSSLHRGTYQISAVAGKSGYQQSSSQSITFRVY